MSKLVIGLTGPIGSGKDSVGLSAEKQFNAKMIAWADELYRQVMEAFSVSLELLQNRSTKDDVNEKMALIHCKDDDFVNLMVGQYSYSLTESLSPREVLRKWGTEYRRAQDPDYWTSITNKAIECLDVDIVFVSGTRFDNEIDLVYGREGFLLHVTKPGVEKVMDHASEKEIPFREGVDHALHNSGSLDDLDIIVRNFCEGLGYQVKPAVMQRRIA